MRYDRPAEHACLLCRFRTILQTITRFNVAYIIAATGIAARRSFVGRPAGWQLCRASPIGRLTFRATGITACLANAGALGNAEEMAHASPPRTKKLSDRIKERHTKDKVRRIRL